MKIICDTTEFQLEQPSAVAIGKFDGLHRGHLELIHLILEQKKRGRSAVAFTFFPSPAVLFSGEPVQELATREEKRAAFEALGIDILIEYPMNFESASIDPELFVEKILHRQMNSVFIAAGEDVSFGNKGLGDAQLLQRLSMDYNYQLKLIEKIKDHENREISSTLVRDAVREGRMEEAADLLGAPYSVRGAVQHGKKLGRTLGMPTVNLIPEEGKLLPPNGVYYSRVLAEGIWHRAITNIGCKPTVSKEKQMGVESYLYDYSGDLYGKQITVELLEFKRPERRFHDVEELKQAMAADIEAGRSYGLAFTQ